MTPRASLRLAARRGARRRSAEIPPPERPSLLEPEPLPDLECPDEDREFVPWPRHTLTIEAAPLEAALCPLLEPA